MSGMHRSDQTWGLTDDDVVIKVTVVVVIEILT